MRIMLRLSREELDMFHSFLIYLSKGRCYDYPVEQIKKVITQLEKVDEPFYEDKTFHCCGDEGND